MLQIGEFTGKNKHNILKACSISENSWGFAIFTYFTYKTFCSRRSNAGVYYNRMCYLGTLRTFVLWELTIVTSIWISKEMLILNTSSFITRSTIWTIYYHVPSKTQSVVLISYINTFYNCGDKAELGSWVGEKRSKIFLNKL